MINYTKKENKKSPLKRLLSFVFVFLFVASMLLFLKAGNTFSLVSNNSFWEKNQTEDNYNEKDRIDILILGIRGEDDENYGGTLTDSIMLMSIKTDQNKVALISLPRDLYAKIPKHAGLREKINYAYAFGENKGIGGINLSKQVVENITGVNIDYAVVVNFQAFEDLINAVGGIDIYLKKEFVETSQWGWEFRLPAGKNTLDGETALYYARSRFSTDDFDRARRQQEIILALKEKLLSAGVLANPVKLNNIFNVIGDNIKTNIDFKTGVKLLKYAKYMDENMTKKVLSTQDDGLLQQGKIDGIYVLYPKAGLDNFEEIKKEIRSIFD